MTFLQPTRCIGTQNVAHRLGVPKTKFIDRVTALCICDGVAIGKNARIVKKAIFVSEGQYDRLSRMPPYPYTYSTNPVPTNQPPPNHQTSPYALAGSGSRLHSQLPSSEPDPGGALVVGYTVLGIWVILLVTTRCAKCGAKVRKAPKYRSRRGSAASSRLGAPLQPTMPALD